MTIGIILAAGKGTRLQSKTENKTSLLFNGKPLVQYGLHLFEDVVDKTVIVVGAFADSVIQLIPPSPTVDFVHQYEQLGTGHAVVVAVQGIEKLGLDPKRVIVGYGDHMMYYTKPILNELLALHEEKTATVTLISTEYDPPDSLGRIVRDSNGEVMGIVESKDANEEQLKISEVNAGLYCFDYEFLRENADKLTKSPVSGEYYINEFIRLAKLQNKTVAALKVPFKYVGIGINTESELEKSRLFHANINEKTNESI